MLLLFLVGGVFVILCNLRSLSRTRRAAGANLYRLLAFRQNPSYHDRDDGEDEHDAEQRRGYDEQNVARRKRLLAVFVVRIVVVVVSEIVLLHGNLRCRIVEEERADGRARQIAAVGVFERNQLFFVRALLVRAVGIAQFVLVERCVVTRVGSAVVEGERVIKGDVFAEIFVGSDVIFLFQIGYGFGQDRVVVGGRFGNVAVEERVRVGGEPRFIVVTRSRKHLKAVGLGFVACVHVERNVYPAALVARAVDFDHRGERALRKVFISVIVAGDVRGQVFHDLRMFVFVLVVVGVIFALVSVERRGALLRYEVAVLFRIVMQVGVVFPVVFLRVGVQSVVREIVEDLGILLGRIFPLSETYLFNLFTSL